MTRRIATSITFSLFSAALACGALPAHAKPAGSAKTEAASKKPMEAKTEKVMLQGVRLITPEKEIEANTDPADFARFVGEINTAVEYIMHASPQGTNLLIKAECSPTGKTVLPVVQDKPGEKLQTLVNQLYEALNAIENVKVKSGKIEFRMEYVIKP